MLIEHKEQWFPYTLPIGTKTEPYTTELFDLQRTLAPSNALSLLKTWESARIHAKAANYHSTPYVFFLPANETGDWVPAFLWCEHDRERLIVSPHVLPWIVNG